MEPFTRQAVTHDGVIYAPGRQFRVTGAGAALDGWIPLPGGGYRSWQQGLWIGCLLTCTGGGPGHGYDPEWSVVEFTTAAAAAAGACHCTIWPMTGDVFSLRPAAGLIEPAGAGTPR